jgi:hypothetical protein
MVINRDTTIIRWIMKTYDIGLKSAIDRYDYLSCYGELSIKKDDVLRVYPAE